MTTLLYEKLKKEIKKELFHELGGLIIRDAKDPEGEYRPEFVKRLLHISRGVHAKKYYNKKNFLKLIS